MICREGEVGVAISLYLSLSRVIHFPQFIEKKIIEKKKRRKEKRVKMIGREAKFLPEESGPPRYIKEYIFKKPKSPFCHTKKTLSISANPRATLQPFQQLKKIEKK